MDNHPGETVKKRDLSKLLMLGVLNMGQFFPQALTATALPFLFRKEGLPLEMFWLLALPGIPRWFKWLIALAVDGLGRHSRIGHRKSWIIPCTLIGATTYALLAWIPPSLSSLHFIVAALIFKSLVMAAQDVAVDAYAAESMTVSERPVGTSIIYFLAIVGTILGNGAVVLVDKVGWVSTMFAASMLLVLAAMPAVIRPEPLRPSMSRGPQVRDERPSLRRALARKETRYILPYMLILGFGVAFTQSMLGPFFADKGLSLTQFGTIALVAGVVGASFGALFTPWCVGRIGLRRTAMIGIASILPLQGAMLGAIAYMPDLPPMPILIGMVSCVLVAMTIYDTCASISRFRWVSRSQPGTDYSLSSSVFQVGSWLAGSTAGFVAAQVGWLVFFPLAAIVTCLGGAIYLWLFDRTEAMVLEREAMEAEAAGEVN